ncbi:MAG: protein putative AbiEii toxin, Type system [Massilia sp.]|nr:protein putative AbiEii toxin, Type system [Massilia sp.]
MGNITRIAFCGLRTLKALTAPSPDIGSGLYYWPEESDWYEAKKINLLVGPNGAGKSTILDVLSLVNDPRRLATLPRENRRFDSAAALCIDFDSKTRLRVEIQPNSKNDAPSEANLVSGIDSQHIHVRVVTLADGQPDRKLNGLALNVSKVALAVATEKSLAAIFEECRTEVRYWKFSPNLRPQDVVKVLNKAGKLLSGLISSPGVAWNGEGDQTSFYAKQAAPFVLVSGEAERVGVCLADDQAQFSNVSIATLPSGWQQLVSILAWLEAIPRGCVALIDEPETHLHPSLQRHLVERMNQIAEERFLQLFIATHSPSIQNPAAWRGHEDQVCVFQANGSGLSKEPNLWRLLDELGVRSSDIAQSNGIIWVEGPSDRIYLKHWLTMWCRNQHPPALEPIENVDYSFAFYGGSILSHYAATESDGKFIDLLRVNRNMALFMDRDNDFSNALDGSLLCLNENSAKWRIIQEFEKLDGPHCKHWVTDGYTIESYLPAKFIAAHFENKDGQLVPKWRTKAAISGLYVSDYSSFTTAVANPVVLGPKIAELHALITRWTR